MKKQLVGGPKCWTSVWIACESEIYIFILGAFKLLVTVSQLRLRSISNQVLFILCYWHGGQSTTSFLHISLVRYCVESSEDFSIFLTLPLFRTEVKLCECGEYQIHFLKSTSFNSQIPKSEKPIPLPPSQARRGKEGQTDQWSSTFRVSPASPVHWFSTFRVSPTSPIQWFSTFRVSTTSPIKELQFLQSKNEASVF
jgi:hypothetical protein